jgi:hypothetical protein
MRRIVAFIILTTSTLWFAAITTALFISRTVPRIFRVPGDGALAIGSRGRVVYEQSSKGVLVEINPRLMIVLLICSAGLVLLMLWYLFVKTSHRRGRGFAISVPDALSYPEVNSFTPPAPRDNVSNE